MSISSFSVNLLLYCCCFGTTSYTSRKYLGIVLSLQVKKASTVCKRIYLLKVVYVYVTCIIAICLIHVCMQGLSDILTFAGTVTIRF